MTATDELRRMLDEHGIEHDDEFIKSAISYCAGYEGTYWDGDSFGYVEPIRPKPNTIGSHPELTIHDCTPEQAIAATKLWNTRAERDDDLYDTGFANGVKATLQQLYGLLHDYPTVDDIEAWADRQWEEEVSA